MTEKVRVADRDEIGPGERKLELINGSTVGILNVDGDFYAIENECAHQGGPICSGDVHNEYTGEVEELGKPVKEYYTDKPVISCPWHGWEYDLRSGRHLGDGDEGVRTYEVVEEDDGVFVLSD